MFAVTHSLPELITSTMKEREKAQIKSSYSMSDYLFNFIPHLSMNEFHFILFSLLGPNRSRFVSLNLMLVFNLFSFSTRFLEFTFRLNGDAHATKNLFLSYVIIGFKIKLIHTLVVWIDFFFSSRNWKTKRHGTQCTLIISWRFSTCFVGSCCCCCCPFVQIHIWFQLVATLSLNCFRSKY